MTEESEKFLLAKRVANRIGRPFGINPFPRAFANPLSADQNSRGAVFDAVYKTNFWGSAQSRSGVGSERAFAGKYAAALVALLERRGLLDIFDAPCGDLNWMVEAIAGSRLNYRGGDISEFVIAQAAREHPEMSVQVFDICEDEFPSMDVWHCRDCLFHLPLADIRRALSNFSTSRIPYALLTTHKARVLHSNLDVVVGGFRYLDLERAPISLPPAEEYLPDYIKGVEFPRYVGLWRRESIAECIARWQETGS